MLRAELLERIEEALSGQGGHRVEGHGAAAERIALLFLDLPPRPFNLPLNLRRADYLLEGNSQHPLYSLSLLVVVILPV